jgi:hypothetical protein
MKSHLWVSLLLVIATSTSVLAGTNRSAKVAIHVKAHYAKQNCQGLPAISDSSDIVTTLDGADIDFFPVFFGLTECLGVEYGVEWPGWMNGCVFTSCSDLVIGDIEWPGDGISHAWRECRYAAVVIPGWGWLQADSAGTICMVPHPDAEAISVLDCREGIDEPLDNFCAGVFGAVGDDPAGGGRGGAPEGGGASGGIRGYYKP